MIEDELRSRECVLLVLLGCLPSSWLAYPGPKCAAAVSFAVELFFLGGGGGGWGGCCCGAQVVQN